MINFILGIMFMAVALPILDKLVELFQTAVNAKISDINVGIQQNNVDIQSMRPHIALICWYWNINQFAIVYTFQSRLRTRLTLR